MTALRPGMSVRELVPGDPGRVLSLATQLLSIASGFDQSARAFRPRADAWFGPAQEAFVALIGAYPPLYQAAAQSFAAASGACRSHAGELAEAQLEARAALRRVEEAVQLSAAWHAAKRERERLSLTAAAGDVGAASQLASLRPLGDDPGEALMRTLSARVAAAQQRVEHSAQLAARRLHEAAKARIPEPNVAMRTVLRAANFERQFVFGAAEATYDVGAMAVTFNPTRIITDPAGFTADTVGLAAGLKYGATHPVELGKAVLDWETWATNPGRALGHLAPDAVIAAVTGGASAASRSTSATKRTLDAPLSPRTFTSDDPLVGDVATALDKEMPGRVLDINNHIPMDNGRTREIDIDLGDIAIQVKSDNARGLTKQMMNTASTTNRKPVGYAPTIPNGAWENAARLGLPIARSLDELLVIIKELS